MLNNNIVNFAIGTVSSSFTAIATSFTLSSGHGSRFGTAPFNVVLWNSTDYANPADAYWAGEAEILTVGAVSSSSFTSCVRGRESTAGIASISGKVYRVALFATAQWLRGSEMVNVKAPPFNARGNGVTDDAAAIQAAIDAVETIGKGVVYFPPGTYFIDTKLEVTSDEITLMGAGKNVTEIKTHGCSAIEAVGAGTPKIIRRFIVKDMTIIDYDTGYLTSIGLNISAYCLEGRFEELKIASFGGSNMIMRGGMNSIIEHCYFSLPKASASGHNLWVYRAQDDTSPTTLVTIGNHFASNTNPASSVRIEDMKSWTSIGDIIELVTNAGGLAMECLDSDHGLGCSELTFFNLHLEAITPSPEMVFTDCQRVHFMGGMGNPPSFVWTALTPEAARYHSEYARGTDCDVKGLKRIMSGGKGVPGLADIDQYANIQLFPLIDNTEPVIMFSTENTQTGYSGGYDVWAKNSGGTRVKIGTVKLYQGPENATMPKGRFVVTLTPTAGSMATKLELDGDGNLTVYGADVETDAHGSGLIVSSANGSHRKRIGIDNSGNLLLTAL